MLDSCALWFPSGLLPFSTPNQNTVLLEKHLLMLKKHSPATGSSSPVLSVGGGDVKMPCGRGGMH